MGTALLKFAFVWGLCFLIVEFVSQSPHGALIPYRFLVTAILGFIAAVAFMTASLAWMRVARGKGAASDV